MVPAEITVTAIVSGLRMVILSHWFVVSANSLSTARGIERLMNNVRMAFEKRVTLGNCGKLQYVEDWQL